MDKAYIRQVRLNKLHDELIAAGITPTLVEGDPNTAGVATYVHIAAPGLTAPVDAVVNAHDSTTLGPVETRAQDDRAAISGFPTRAQVKAALDDITTDLATLNGTPTNAQVVAILRRTVTNQKNIIQALNVLVRRG